MVLSQRSDQKTWAVPLLLLVERSRWYHLLPRLRLVMYSTKQLLLVAASRLPAKRHVPIHIINARRLDVSRRLTVSADAPVTPEN